MLIVTPSAAISAGTSYVPPTGTFKLPTGRPCKLHLMLHGDVLEVFVDDRISLCARVQSPTGALALLARDGQVSLNNLRITQLP